MSFVRRQLAGIMLLAGLSVGIAVGVIVPLVIADPLEEGDLVAAGVNNCVTAITGRLALLDTESIGDFDEATIAELRTLPARCQEPEVRAVLEADYPALLHALAVTGSPRSSPRTTTDQGR